MGGGEGIQGIVSYSLIRCLNHTLCSYMVQTTYVVDTIIINNDYDNNNNNEKDRRFVI